MDKLSRLKGLYEEWQELELFDSFKHQGFINWQKNWKKGKWVKYSDCDPADLENATLRTILPNELIIDIDFNEEDKQRFKSIEDKKEAAIDKIKKDNLTFELWKSGGKGYHIHIKIPSLAEFEVKLRTLIKEYLINRYFGDTAKKGHRTMIAIEYSKHHKTGRFKALEGPLQPNHINTLPAIVSDFIKTTTPAIDNYSSKKILSKAVSVEFYFDYFRKLDYTKYKDYSIKKFYMPYCLYKLLQKQDFIITKGYRDRSLYHFAVLINKMYYIIFNPFLRDDTFQFVEGLTISNLKTSQGFYKLIDIICSRFDSINKYQLIEKIFRKNFHFSCDSYIRQKFCQLSICSPLTCNYLKR